MAKVRIIKEFRDRDRFSKVYPVGEVFEFESARAKSLLERGLVEPVRKGKADKE